MIETLTQFLLQKREGEREQFLKMRPSETELFEKWEAEWEVNGAEWRISGGPLMGWPWTHEKTRPKPL